MDCRSRVGTCGLAAKADPKSLFNFQAVSFNGAPIKPSLTERTTITIGPAFHGDHS
jgi:hypothetical protein